jgi:hypothetical protein
VPKETTLNYQVFYQRHRRPHYAEGDFALRTCRVGDNVSIMDILRYLNQALGQSSHRRDEV